MGCWSRWWHASFRVGSQGLNARGARDDRTVCTPGPWRGGDKSPGSSDGTLMPKLCLALLSQDRHQHPGRAPTLAKEGYKGSLKTLSASKVCARLRGHLRSARSAW